MNLRHIATPCFLGMIFLSGCADERANVSEERLKAMRGGAELKPVFPVRGAVKVDGKPAQGVAVLLYRATDTKEPYLESRTDQDGKYCFTTVDTCDGVEAGSYFVAFTQIPNPRRNGKGVDLLKGKYRDPKKNKIALKVESGVPQENVNYELSTK